MKLLIVDDEKDICFILSYEATAKGYTPICFENGEGAKEFLLTHSADAIICDHNMSGISGLELWNWMKDNNKSIPFILLTGESFNQDKKIKDSGIFEVLQKPHDIKKVGALLKQIGDSLKT